MTGAHDAARGMAIEALAHIAADPDLATALLAQSGLQPADLRRIAGSDDTALAVLDFLLEDDCRVIGFAAQAGLDPGVVMRARTLLAGPGSAGWEVD